MPTINELTKMIKPSATLSLKEEVKSLEKEYGLQIIDLTAGQPDTGPTEDVLEALSDGGKLHKYGPVQGELELRETLCGVIDEEVGVKYSPQDITITAGAKGGIDMLMRVLVAPGDVVGIMTPFWVTYPESAKIAQAVPHFLESSTDLRVDPGKLRRGVKTNKVKVLLYSSPCNPSGVLYTSDDLKAIAEVAKEENIWVIADEIYRKFVFDGKKAESILSIEGIRDNTVLVDGPSKRFGVPGWRVGYVAGPAEVIKAVVKLQGHTSSGASRPAQHAMCVAYTSPKAREATEDMRRRYQKNRDTFVEGLNRIEGITCIKPEGAFYAFPDVEWYFGRKYEFAGNEYVINGSVDFRNFLLRKAQVAGVEGAPFGMDGHIRFSLATREEDCVNSLANIKRALQDLR
ncbi:MAG: aminotransferase class I/II-fold pyridoxal phosphate-dependent enzyme [Chloroflexota bacterium]|nr:aminotransferase class I/II-fold pyridoxal phosphate-dependent enzyme [Chloroflexota bacterium]